jgi:hypothetical protein
MSRTICFFDEELATQAICLNEGKGVYCKDCNMNPFPNRIVPEDRVLRKSMNAPFEYEPLTDDEHTQMMSGRVFLYPHRTRGRHQSMKQLHKTSVYTVEYEPITAEEWAAMTVGEHRFPRSRNNYPQRGRGITRLRFSLRNPRRR